MKTYLVLILAIAILLAGCNGSQSTNNQANEQNTVPDVPDADTPNTDEQPEQTKSEQDTSTISPTIVNNTENSTCQKTCKGKSVVIKTSDGNELNLIVDKGSYTSAGAIEWKIININDSCKDETPTVDIEITKNYYGKLLSKETITIEEGKSKTLTHPKMTSIKFTLEVKSVEREC